MCSSDLRSGMVQTEAQYKFIYHAVSYYIDAEKAKLQASKVGQGEVEEKGGKGEGWRTEGGRSWGTI